ncbi:MAG TPA: hypothetical protein VK905_04780 [Bacillota bacterium]|nr:hypothetical protein [Bacillota bacterium]
MDTRRKARLARAISQLARVLDEDGIPVWLGGEWSRCSLDPDHIPSESSALFYLYADDAPDVRRTAEDLDHAVVDLSPSGFTTEKGDLLILWQMLWTHEGGDTLSFDERDRPYHWPPGSFVAEFRGVLSKIPIRIVDPQAEMLHDSSASNKGRQNRRRTDICREKAIIHDRM